MTGVSPTRRTFIVTAKPAPTSYTVPAKACGQCSGAMEQQEAASVVTLLGTANDLT